MSKMKIALIGTTAGCVIGFRADFIKTLVAEGFQVYALALDYDDVTRKKVVELGGYPIDYNFSRTGLNPLHDIVNTIKLASLLKRLAPDLVFSYFAKPVIFGTLAARLAGVPRRIGMLEGLGYVFTDHPAGISIKTKALRIVQVFLYRLSFPFLERIIFLNPDDPKDLLDSNNLYVKNVSVLGGIGLNLDDYPYSVPSISPISFIFVGRLLAEKGVHEYVGAAKLVKAQFPEVNFIMLGGLDESNPGGLSALSLKQLTLQGIVIYPGHVNDVPEWLNRASVFVLPSYYREGVPRSTQEAMAIGRAILTTDVPGCRETVIDGKNGYLIPPWSSAILAEKMINLIENPSYIIEMGIESRSLAQENFDARKVNAKLIKFIL